MKTALVKTNLWDDDVFYGLNIDTKLIYLSLLTSPERGVGRIFKVSDRIISARTGLSIEQIKVCKKQLDEQGLVNFFDGWVSLTDKSSYVQPVKGKLTEITLKRELSEIPPTVIEAFVDLTDEVSPVNHMSPTGDPHVHVNDNDNVHDHVNDNDNDKPVIYGKPEINELFDEWQEIVGYAIVGDVQRNRRAANNLLKRHKKDGVIALIRGVDASQSDKYAPRISDFVSLQAKANDLIAWGKRTGASSKPKVGIA